MATQGGGKSKRMRNLLIVGCAAIAALSLPAAAGAHPSGVDQYTQYLPGAGGPQTPSGNPPTARPDLLPPQTRAALSGTDGRELVQIATATGLGAPAVVGTAAAGSGHSSGSPGAAGSAAGTGSGAGPAAVAGSGRSLPAAVADTAGSGPGVALIAALVAIVAL